MADQPKQSLALSYAMSRRNPKMRPAKLAHGGEACPHCAAGSCAMHMKAEGGMVENDLAAHEAKARESLELPADRMPESHVTHMEHETPEPESLGTIVSKVKSAKPKFAEGGLVDEILASRRPAPAPEETEELGPAAEDLMEEEVDLSNYHSMDDAEHDNIPATESESLVGQILKERRSKRRGL